MRDFNHTVNILVKAFFAGELENNVCAACAVGNMIAAAMYTRPAKTAKLDMYKHIRLDPENPSYCDVWENGRRADWVSAMRSGKPNVQTRMTGYTPGELMRIERAFEGFGVLSNSEYKRWIKLPKTDKQFEALMRVVDVLADIHNVDLTSKEVAKQLFVKA
jgi:hypothetical protein